MQLIGHEYIQQTRAYCDYLEEHFNNITKAFDEVYSKCKHLLFFADDFNYHTLYHQVELHDISKFSAEEFTQYRNHFFPVTKEESYLADLATAYSHHAFVNTHHIQSIKTKIDVLHMIIDLTAMSYKFGGTAQSYYESKQHNVNLPSELVEFMYTIFNALKEQQ